ncbi:TaqI-like C-terminal specificity domain-containing protein [Desulfitobacterium metallireducens]|uniref:site-specific DNA-methyltransferase (adenine-specific) n=1 Tax=Desulfitobacterium metallireducens DSM 15288 TaxID=871968 RepID=W0EGM3_9FIRM|nr:TaqI-like C-terminal specificity domain-containing protein [Desulfitobacterium metallireducens]AHF08196.1 N-6 DNA Methylase [Desulfitobacterium metallireducens DSM 15288]
MKQLELFSAKDNLMNLEEVSKLLSISTATARNWIKGKKIKPIKSAGREILFAKDEIELLLDNIKSGKEARLKSRRNKSYVSGAFIPKTYIQSKEGIDAVDKITSQINTINLPEGYERIILAEYALKLLLSRELVPFECDSSNCLLHQYITDKVVFGDYSALIDDVLSNVSQLEVKIRELEPALCIPISFLEDQDFLGLLYMSLQSLGERKSNGVYYTPLTVVKDAVDNLKSIHKNTKLLDPCCGTGNFLMYAHKYIQNLEGIYGFDISPLSIALTRINMALVSRTQNIELLYKNFECKDALIGKEALDFDIVIGNPPWGFNYSEDEQTVLKERYQASQAKTVESFCVFTEYASKTIVQNGIVCFVLPQSLLNVKIHQPIRDYLLGSSYIKRIRYWENIFDGVQCPAMTLVFEKIPSGFSIEGMEVVTDQRTFTIKRSRDLDRTNWYFDLTDEEMELIKKIESSVQVTYLKDNADFALGIVTGDNSTYISKVQSEGSEIILRGSDIFKYEFVPSNNYIRFEPERFQQVAPTHLYRAPEKLIYRFICNRLVFAYDNNQTLTLNSANILIPRIPGIGIKYILAILNSSTIQYFFNNKFKSVKILRAHLESLPIPVVSAELQSQIIRKVDEWVEIKDPSEMSKLYEDLDAEVSKLFGLTESDYQIIKTSISKSNPFLLGSK